jgi:PAS domain S-box-containing protein
MAPGTKKPEGEDGGDPLRSEAERKLADHRVETPSSLSGPAEKLVHELQVHQIELEMQNEALREARLALEESRDTYLDLYEFAPVGYFTLSKDAVIVEGNLTGAAMLGVDRRKLIKDRFRKFVAPEDREKWDRYFIAVSRTGEKLTDELKLQKSEGSPFHARLESIRKERGKEDHVIRIAISDITAQKRGEDQLKVFRTFTENAQDIILFIRKSDGKIIEANRRATEIYGFSHDELLGMKIFDLRPADPKKLVERQIREAEATGILFEAVHRKKDGTEIPVEVNSFSMQLEGDPIIFSIIRDITLRRKAEEAILRLSGERKTLIDNVPAMIWYKDTHNTIVRVNPEVERIFGAPAKAIEGKSAYDLFPDEARDYYVDDLEVISSGIPKFNIIQQMPTADGRKLWVRTEKIPVRDELGTITGLLVFSVDITGMKRAEDELIQRSDDVQAANEELMAIGTELRENEARLTASLEEKDALLAEVHHRVKNNLAAFISLLALDGTYEESPAGQRLKTDLQNRARSMALIHETLYRTRKFSSVDMGVYLSTLTEQIAGTYQTGKSVRILVDANGINLDLSRATPTGLIVNELLTNSFKYAFPASFDCEGIRHEPCTLRVSLTFDDGMYTLRVGDNGIGLPAKFDPKKATSLGLKLVNFLARHQLRAKIEFDTAKGTEYTLRFSDKVTHSKSA